LGEKNDLKLYSGEKITNRNFRCKSNQNSIHANKQKQNEKKHLKQSKGPAWFMIHVCEVSFVVSSITMYNNM
jgi:hypothetical protein